MANITIHIDGMSCMHCVTRVKKAIEKLNGIRGLTVEVGVASIDFDESVVTQDDIKETITLLGYKINEGSHPKG